LILLTAFEPFGGSGVNASLEAARLVAADPRVRLAVLPVARGAAEAAALRALCRLHEAGTPARLMLALGEAGPEPVVRLEKVGVNWDDFRIPDNAGNRHRDEPVRPGGPDARFATLPVGRIERALEGRTPLRVRVSLSAGAFLCNHLAYAVADAMATGAAPPCPFLFVHVPCWRPTGDGDDSGLHAIVSTIGAILAEAFLR
jgi:pyroglutamyl-peptidase